jgi:transcriptional regulator with XRE-family HTH domain
MKFQSQTEVPMTTPQARRITRDLTPEELNRLRRQREQIASELPDLAERDRMRKEASEEVTLSGELRRAVHGCPLSLSTIAERAGISPLALDEFLTGERTLRSDVLDRLACILGYLLQPKE